MVVITLTSCVNSPILPKKMIKVVNIQMGRLRIKCFFSPPILHFSLFFFTILFFLTLFVPCWLVGHCPPGYG